MQLYADLYQRPFVRPRVTEAGTLGAALLAGISTGVYNSPGEAAATAVHIDTEFHPRRESAAAYEASYRRYREIWRTLETTLRGSREAQR